jgi:hypothetical protein
MSLYRIGAAVLIAAALLGILASCQSLALSGSRKYKTDLLNALLNIESEIEKDGAVTDRNIDKLEKVLARYEPEYGKKASFMYASEVLRICKDVQTNKPADAFSQYKSVQMQITNTGEVLKTEVE